MLCMQVSQARKLTIRGRKVTPSSEIFSENRENSTKGEGRIIATIQTIEPNLEHFTSREKLRCGNGQEEHIINLHRGGCIKIFPNLVPEETCKRVKQELLGSGLFRRYQVQAQDEPRAHFLLHEDADDDFNGKEQPGYHYSTATLKARPLSKLEAVKNLSADMANHCGIQKWTIGVNPVLYRDGNDKMGDHADDDQGEQIILAVIVDAAECEDKLRRVRVNPFKRLEPQQGDEDIELFLRPGDAYQMDGEMQAHYSHSVPPDKQKPKRKEEERSESTGTVKVEEDSKVSTTRIVIVFRTGNCVYFKKDSGKPCPNLSPQPRLGYTFGSLACISEGNVYTRNHLIANGAHLGLQRGLSGNKDVGCDAIIVSGAREDGLGDDKFVDLMYAVESSKGAEGMRTSFENELPIRVFRSTGYDCRFGAKAPNSEGSNSRQMYRYDGLYEIIKFDAPATREAPYQFYLSRCGRKNNISNRHFHQHCVDLNTMRGEESAYPKKRGRQYVSKTIRKGHGLEKRHEQLAKRQRRKRGVAIDPARLRFVTGCSLRYEVGFSLLDFHNHAIPSRAEPLYHRVQRLLTESRTAVSFQ